MLLPCYYQVNCTNKSPCSVWLIGYTQTKEWFTDDNIYKKQKIEVAKD